MESYPFTKKLSMRGNLEMRTNFGRQKVIVLTRVNGYYYVNLYNNSTKNPGRCSFGYDEFIELIGMSHILEQLKPQFDEDSNHQQHDQQQQDQQQQQDKQQMPPPPYTAQHIKVLGINKRQSNLAAVGGAPPAKALKLQHETIQEENVDPMMFFSQFQ